MSDLILTPPPVVPEFIGIWGLEGRHEWNGQVTLNRRQDDAGERVYPCYKLDRISGLHSLGDSEDVRELAVGRRGEVPRRSFRRGKTVTYEGMIQALSLAELRQATTLLAAAFDDQMAEKQMVVTPHPDYATGSRFFYARALGLEIPDEQALSAQRMTRGYERPFALSVRMSDARFYDGEGKSETLTAANADDGPTVEVTNAGTVETEPVLTLTSTRAIVGSKAPVNLAGWLQFAGTGPTPALTRTGNTIDVDGRGPWAMDGVLLEAGMRVLYCDPTGTVADDDFGIWDVLSSGGGTLFNSQLILRRSTDADSSAEMTTGILVPVLGGGGYAGNTFELVTPATITLNTTALKFSLLDGIPGIAIGSETLQVGLHFPGIRLLDGDELVIDFARRAITLNGVDGSGLLDPASQWWDAGVAGLVAGSNTIRLTSVLQTVDAPFDVTAEIAWHDAYA
jgi:hypothetical protein